LGGNDLLPGVGLKFWSIRSIRSTPLFGVHILLPYAPTRPQETTQAIVDACRSLTSAVGTSTKKRYSDYGEGRYKYGRRCSPLLEDEDIRKSGKAIVGQDAGLKPVTAERVIFG
jgi:hypothetical protein